jgi:hypothetical protein
MKKLSVSEREYIQILESWLREKSARILDCRACITTAMNILRENRKQLEIHRRAYRREKNIFIKWKKAHGLSC